MTARRDPDRLIYAFLMEGQTELADPVFDAVRATIEQKRQRVVIGPWRTPVMNKFLAVGLGTAALIVALVVGARFLAPPGSGGVGGVPSTTPSATAAPTATPAPTTTPAPTPTPIGGTVEFQLDGVPVTTVVTAIADGSSVSGTAVSTSAFGTHTVRLECAARQGDRWAFAGTTEQTTVPDERVGDWSAIVVKDGTPQQIGIVFSIQKAEGDFCYARWASMAMADMDVSNPVESGELEPPPDLAP